MNIIFFGTPDFAVVSLQALIAANNINVKAVVTQPDKPAHRGKLVHASPVKILALENNIPVLQPLSIRKSLDSFMQELKRFAPLDLAVVVAFGQILPEAVLKFPSNGSVNVHASLLPRWRGAAPIQRAMLMGDEFTGVCLMQMEKDLDSGPIFSCRRCKIEPDHTFKTLHDQLAREGASLLIADLPRINSSELVAQAQSSVGVTYAQKIESAEALINWFRPAHEIRRQIYALNPTPGAYTFYNGKRLKILRANIKHSGNFQITPGLISDVTKNEMVLGCADGLLSLEEVQLEGKKVLPIAEFLKGAKIVQGDKLG